jgi:DNA repair protein RAD57
VILDSIAANYRAERSPGNTPSALATRSAQLVKLGALLRGLAREHNCAIVVANQVADRFAPTSTASRASAAGPNHLFSSSPASTATNANSNSDPTPSVLSLDHQQRFFTGWGDHPFSSPSSSQSANLKTPSLGLVWTNQIACRIALIKERDYGSAGTGEGGAEWNARRWRRWMKLVFAPWAGGMGDNGVELEIWAGGMRAINSNLREKTTTTEATH